MVAPLGSEGKTDRSVVLGAGRGIWASLDPVKKSLSLTILFAAALALSGPVTHALAQSDWQVFPSEDGQFEAMFPAMPGSYTDQRVRNGVMATTRVLAAGTPAFYCMAGYTEYSGSLAHGIRPELEAARDDFIASWYATLLENRDVTILRPPQTVLQAVRFIAIADTRRYTSIMATDGLRFYHVVASSQRFGFSEADIARCLSGFKLRPAS